MLRATDPIVATLQFAYREIVENEYTDPELAIAAAAFVLHGPGFDYLAVSQEAAKYHRANRTFGAAIRAAKDHRKSIGLFGTYNAAT